MERGKGKEMKRITLMTDIGQTVYVVFASKREGYKDNVVLKAVVTRAEITQEKHVLYKCKPIKVVTDKGESVKKYVNSFYYKNSNIDTGVSGAGKMLYPVFTDKEKCLKWLRG